MSKHQHSGNDSGHDSYEQVAAARRSRADYREGYEEARRAFLIGRVVRERRLALGLSQTEVAARAGMTQPALSGSKPAASSPPSRSWNVSHSPSTPNSSSLWPPPQPESRARPGRQTADVNVAAASRAATS